MKIKCNDGMIIIRWHICIYTHTHHATDDDDYNESNGCYGVRTDFYLHYYLQEDYVIIGIGIGIEKIEFVGIFFFKYKTSLTKTNTFSQFIIAIQMAEIIDFFSISNTGYCRLLYEYSIHYKCKFEKKTHPSYDPISI